MSCDAAASAVFLWLAATGAPAQAIPAQPSAMPPPAVAQEPLFADIVRRAADLKLTVDALQGRDAPLPPDFRRAIRELSALDMQGHVVLSDRGIDSDLKCILRGIAQDLPLKLADLEAAADPKARDRALRDMGYLLRDNVEVITAPPAPPV